MTDAGTLAPHPARRWQFWLFVIVMLALTGVFLALAAWQLERLSWKEGLIATATRNMKRPPTPLPPASAWPGLDPQDYQYRPVTVTGHYVPTQTIRVFVGLSESARGAYSGPGYWIVTPFVPTSGGTVFIDQGFVPQDLAGKFLTGGPLPTGTVTLAGVAVPTEAGGAFTPAPDTAHRIVWSRDIAKMTAMLGPNPGPVAPVYIDLPAGQRGALPQGGETTVDFTNNHLGYVYTWLGFALTTVIMLAEWVRRQWSRRPGKSRIIADAPADKPGPAGG